MSGPSCACCKGQKALMDRLNSKLDAILLYVRPEPDIGKSPAKTMAEFETIEARLNDSTYSAKFSDSVDGKSVSLSQFVSKQLITQFNVEGNRGKKSLKNTNLYKALQVAAEKSNIDQKLFNTILKTQVDKTKKKIHVCNGKELEQLGRRFHSSGSLIKRPQKLFGFGPKKNADGLITQFKRNDGVMIKCHGKDNFCSIMINGLKTPCLVVGFTDFEDGLVSYKKFTTIENAYEVFYDEKSVDSSQFGIIYASNLSNEIEQCPISAITYKYVSLTKNSQKYLLQPLDY